MMASIAVPSSRWGGIVERPARRPVAGRSLFATAYRGERHGAASRFSQHPA